MLFVKKGLGTRLAIGFGAVLLLFTAAAAFTLVSMNGVDRRGRQVSDESIPFALLAGSMRRDIVQVQQFLTDAAVTHNAGAIKEAEEHAASFLQGLERFRMMYRAENDAESLRMMDDVEGSFRSFPRRETGWRPSI